MDIFIGILLLLFVAAIGYAIYRAVRIGNRVNRSINDYLKS